VKGHPVSHANFKGILPLKPDDSALLPEPDLGKVQGLHSIAANAHCTPKHNAGV
jgi:hypothetical protein